MSVLADQSSPAAIPALPVKRKRGRPPGSKNKPKTSEDSSRPSCPEPRGRGRGRGRETKKKAAESRGRGRGRGRGVSSSWIEESSVSVSMDEEVER